MIPLLIGTALSCLGFSACISASSVRTWGLQPAAAAQVAHACEATLGVAPGSGWYNACADRLSRTLQARSAEIALDSRHSACARDLEPKTPAFNRCVVERADVASATAVQPSAFVPATHIEARARAQAPFRSLSRPERLHRQRLACAEVGFDPVTPEFRSCVVSLSQAFFQLDNP